MIWWGHSKNDDGNGEFELLKIHLDSVAKRTSEYMQAWGHGYSGRIAGIHHDLGKYADQMRVRLENPVEVAGRNHAAAGACWIAYHYKNSLPLAMAVLYHHGGLKQFFVNEKQMLATLLQKFKDRPNDFTETDLKVLVERLRTEFPDIPSAPISKLFTGKMASDMLDVRMCSSALVDADYIETEAHFSGDSKVPRRYRPEGAALDVDKALSAVELYIKTKIEKKKTKNKIVRDVRRTLGSTCRAAGDFPIGTYSLTAPTGSGKTLSMLLFALLHAKRHRLRRIFLVMPFLNIIDQTAREYRDIFSPENGFPATYVLEDHSLSGFKSNENVDDLENEHQRFRKLMAENWDAPIVLTTSVKFFESLHSCHNSKLRKLHRLAKSIVLFDEAQSLPPDLAPISLATLSRLSEPSGPYGTSVVFATATQPAFESLSSVIDKYSNCGWKAESLIPEEKIKFLFDSMAGRVRVEWRENESLEIETLASELVENPFEQCLCIVNLKRHAQHLADLLMKRMDKNSVFHLSTAMCSKHRKAVLKLVLDRLENNEPVALVSTQCIEAGVDISFPVVYRALAPLESIAQSAGRCNRHGDAIGKVVVFRPYDEKTFYPPGYREGISATETLLSQFRNDVGDPNQFNLLNSPDYIKRYYKLFFALGNYDTGSRAHQQLYLSVQAKDFEEVSRHYRMIPGDMVNVLVPYDKAKFDELRNSVQRRAFMCAEEIRQWVAQAREHSVGLFRPDFDSMKWQALEPVQFGARLKYNNQNADWFICLPAADYDPVCGLKLPESFVGIC